jgi:hypothetical protein
VFQCNQDNMVFVITAEVVFSCVVWITDLLLVRIRRGYVRGRIVSLSRFGFKSTCSNFTCFCFIFIFLLPLVRSSETCVFRYYLRIVVSYIFVTCAFFPTLISEVLCLGRDWDCGCWEVFDWVETDIVDVWEVLCLDRDWYCGCLGGVVSG